MASDGNGARDVPGVPVEIVIVGNELLEGDTQDTNGHWLCARLTARGARVTRLTMVRDDAAAIVEALRRALEAGARLVVTGGGLGPTEDDLTLGAIAEALVVSLAPHPEALAMVAETYRRLAAQGFVDAADLTPERAKMARLPEGATPLANPVGAAPGALLRFGDATIVALPGVPAELRGIYEGSLQPHLEAILGRAVALQWRAVVGSGDESVLAPLLRAVAGRHPEVYLMSRARGFGAERRFLVTLAARGEGAPEAERRLSAAWTDLAAALEGAGIAVVSLDRGA